MQCDALRGGSWPVVQLSKRRSAIARSSASSWVPEVGSEVAAAMGWIPEADPDALEDAEEDVDMDEEPTLNGH